MKKITLGSVTICVLLSGCSSLTDNAIYGKDGIIRDRSQDYELAETRERLEIPAHLNAKATQDNLVIPNVGEVATARVGEFVVPRPEFFYAESGTESVSLKRDGTEKQIVVDEDITNVWVKLQEFWQFNGVDIVKSDPRNGVMETEWIVTEAKKFGFVDTWVKRLTFQGLPGDTKDKLRVNVKPVANEPQRTVISMQHVRFDEDDEIESIDWTNQARDVSFKSDMMFEMLRYLGNATGERSAQTLIAFQENRRQGTQLGRDSRGNPVLRLDTDVDSAWAEINTALDKAKLDVGTRDQSVGIVYMTYATTTPAENKEKLGFFEWLHSDRGPITIDTGFISNAIGLGSDEDDDQGIRYSSANASNTAASETAGNQTVDSGTKVGTVAASEADERANEGGYKIWFGGRPIYVFGGSKKGTYNQDTDSFLHVGQYQLKLIRSRSGVFLSVLTNEAAAAPPVIAEELLFTIKENIPRS